MKKLAVSLTFLLVASMLQASEIVLSPSCRFASLVLTENEYAQWDDSLFETYTQKLYEKFNDDFDFIVAQCEIDQLCLALECISGQNSQLVVAQIAAEIRKID